MGSLEWLGIIQGFSDEETLNAFINGESNFGHTDSKGEYGRIASDHPKTSKVKLDYKLNLLSN